MKKLVALFAAIMIMASGALFTADASQSYGYEESAVWAPDYSEYEAMSIRSLENLADNGDELAAFVLVFRYMENEDNSKAFKYLTMSAELGNADAIYFIASSGLEREMEKGDDMDLENAVSYAETLKIAADMGHQQAQELYNSIIGTLDKK
ncbi:MAG: hypothetical protein J6C59_10455 [Muribaculaceae bacterium]|nr:hypothetical protein [Muribaculaceae bacterium]